MDSILFAPIIVAADSLAQRGVYPTPAGDAWITEAAKTQQYYERVLLQSVRDRYDGKTDDNEFLVIVAAIVAAQLLRAYRDGLAEAGYEGPLDGEMQNDMARITLEEEAHSRKLLAALLAAIAAGTGWQAFGYRMQLWSNRYTDVKNRAVITGGKRTGGKYRWLLGATEKHCTHCADYAGQVKTAVEWDDIYRTLGHRPQSRELECKGYNCDCWLSRVSKE